MAGRSHHRPGTAVVALAVVVTGLAGPTAQLIGPVPSAAAATTSTPTTPSTAGTATVADTAPSTPGSATGTPSQTTAPTASPTTPPTAGSLPVPPSSGTTDGTGSTDGTGTTTSRRPVVTDELDLALPRDTMVPKGITLATLRDVYTRNGAAGTVSCLNISPLLPAYGSAVRTAWARDLGITDYDFGATGTGGSPTSQAITTPSRSGIIPAIPTTPTTPAGTAPAGTTTWGSCVTGSAAAATGVGSGAGDGHPGDRDVNGAPIRTDDGTVLPDGTGQVVPYSVRAYVDQGSGLAPDRRGDTVLATVDFTSPGAGVALTALRYPLVLNASAVCVTSSGFSGPGGTLDP